MIESCSYRRKGLIPEVGLPDKAWSLMSRSQSLILFCLSSRPDEWCNQICQFPIAFLLHLFSAMNFVRSFSVRLPFLSVPRPSQFIILRGCAKCFLRSFVFPVGSAFLSCYSLAITKHLLGFVNTPQSLLITTSERSESSSTLEIITEVSPL